MVNMSRTCSSHCGNNGHNSRKCTDVNGTGAASSGENNGIMLFGVRLTGDTATSFRRSASMTNLSKLYDQSHDLNIVTDSGYASDDVVHPSGWNCERRRGVPWTEEEHKLFLLGLQKVGKGDWRGISKNFVKTRTPTQVASHAQKYFLRRNNQNRRRRRSSLFDITTDTVMKSSTEENQLLSRENPSPPQPRLQISGNLATFPTLYPVTHLAPTTTSKAKSNNSKVARSIPIHPISSKMADLNLKYQKILQDPISPALSLKLSTPQPEENSSQSSHNIISSVA